MGIFDGEDWSEDDLDIDVDDWTRFDQLYNDIADRSEFDDLPDSTEAMNQVLVWNYRQGNLADDEVEEMIGPGGIPRTDTTVGDFDDYDLGINEILEPLDVQTSYEDGVNQFGNNLSQRMDEQDEAIGDNRKEIQVNRRWVLGLFAAAGGYGIWDLFFGNSGDDSQGGGAAPAPTPTPTPEATQTEEPKVTPTQTKDSTATPSATPVDDYELPAAYEGEIPDNCRVNDNILNNVEKVVEIEGGNAEEIGKYLDKDKIEFYEDGNELGFRGNLGEGSFDYSIRGGEICK